MNAAFALNEYWDLATTSPSHVEQMSPSCEISMPAQKINGELMTEIFHQKRLQGKEAY